MKNSILEKARWLREVALATSKNNGARVAREWLKYAAMFVMLFTIGSGNVWGADLCNFTTFNGWPTSAYADNKTYTPSTGVTWGFTGIYRNTKAQAYHQIKKSTSNCVITTPTFASNIGTITVTFSAGKGIVTIKNSEGTFLRSADYTSSKAAVIDISSSKVKQVKICVSENGTATAKMTALQITAGDTKTYHEWDGSSAFTTSTGGSTLKAVPSLCEWAIEPFGWCSEENYASSAYPTDEIWFETYEWPAGKTDLYALYRVGSDPYYYYSTKPTIYTITYNLTNVTKDDAYSYSCMSDMADKVGTSNFYGYFKPAAGYTLDASCISITMGGSPVNSSNYSWNTEYSYPGYDYTAELYMTNITGNVVVTVTGKSCTQLADATGLAVENPSTLDATKVKFTWTLGAGTSTNAAKQVFTLTKVGGASQSKDLTKTTTSGTVALSSLSDGTYNWSIQAIGDGVSYCDGNVVEGPSFTICTKDVSAVTPTVNATTSITKTGATANWTAVSDADHYTVKVYAGATATGSAVKTYTNVIGTSQAITGLTAGTQYCVTVQAHDACSHDSQIGTGGVFTTDAATLYTVTFVNQSGEAVSPAKQSTEGGSVTLPSASPSVACAALGWTFAGWKDGSAEAETTKTPTLIAAGSYTPSENKTFYAVFTKTEGGGGGVKTTLLSSTCADAENFTDEDWPTKATYYLNDPAGALRLGTRKATGSITSKSLSAAVGTTIKVDFEARAYNLNDEGNINVTVSGCDQQSVLWATYGGSTSEYTSCSLSFVTTTPSFTVTIATSQKRAVLKNIEIYYGGGGGGTTYWNSNPSCSNEATVTYHNDGAKSGAAPTDDKSPYTIGDQVTVLGTGTMVAPDGKEFKCWNTAPDGKGTDYNIDAKFEIAANMDFYPKWVNAPYTVRFDAEDGTCGTTSLTEASGGAGVILPAATATCAPAGWSFYGWATSTCSSTTSAPSIVGATGETYHPESDIKLHAVYVNSGTYNSNPVCHEVTIGSHTNGTINVNSSTTSPQTVTQGATVNIAATPESGYRFTTWTITKTTGGDDVTSTLLGANATTASTSFTMPDYDVTVEAVFVEIINYTITWKVNNANYTTYTGPGTLSTSAEGGVKWSTLTLPDAPADNTLSDCDRTKFVGWSTSQLFGDGNDAPADLFKTTSDANADSHTITEATTFYAVFAKGNGDFSFGWESADDASIWTISGFCNKETYNAYKKTGSYAGSIQGSSGYIQLNDKISPTSISCQYTKATSNTNSSSKFIIQTSSNGKDWTDQATGKTMDKVTAGTLYELKWTGSLNDVYVRVCYTGSNAVRVLDDVVISGGSFTDYATQCCTLKPVTNLAVSSTTANSVTLTWTAPSPTTGIDHLELRNASTDAKIGNNIAVGTTTTTVGGLNECTTYTYKIVSVGAVCETPSNIVEATPFGGSNTVTFNYNGGTGTPASFTTSCGNLSTTLPTPDARDGYTFLGWWTAADGGSKVGDAGDNYDVATTTTIHAHWVQNFTVTYELGDGTASPACAGGTYYVGEAVDVCTSTPTRVSSSFLGWLVYKTGDKNTTVTVTAGQFTMPAYNVTIEAQWETVYYHIYYKEEDGTAIATDDVPQTAETTLRNQTPCVGYTFFGWSTSKITSETTSKPSIIGKGGASYTPDADITVYPVYARSEGATTVKDTLTVANTGVTTSYTPVEGINKDKTPKTIHSNAVYAIGAYNSSGMQFTDGTSNEDQKKSSLITTTSGGSLQAIQARIPYAASTTRYLYTKGNTSDYTMQNRSSQGGTLAWTVTHSKKADTWYIHDFSEDGYSSFFMYCGGGATKVDSIIVTWGTGTYYYATHCETKENVTVTYNANGGTTTCGDGEHKVTWAYKNGGADAPELENPQTICSDATRDGGYILREWTTGADGTGTQYAPGATVTSLENDIILYAQWDRVYTVTFNDQGAITSRTQASGGASVAVPSNPTPCNTKPGVTWTFVGWGSQDGLVQSLNGHIVITAGTSTYTPSDDITLYAVYRKSTGTSDAFALGTSGAYTIGAKQGAGYAECLATVKSGTGYNCKNDGSEPATIFYLNYINSGEHIGQYTMQDGNTGEYVCYSGNSTGLSWSSTTPYYYNVVANGTGWNLQFSTATGRYFTHETGSTASSFKAYQSTNPVTLHPAAASTYYTVASCDDDFNITFVANGSEITWQVNHGEGTYYHLADGTEVSVFPTASFDGWKFLGWRTADYDESTKAPEASTIYGGSDGTSGNHYVIHSSITMYPVFTRFDDNEPFDQINGGDYYIYFLESGSDDGNGAEKRVYAATYDGSQRYNSSALCSEATTFTFKKLGNGNWTIYDNTTHKYLYGIENDALKQKDGSSGAEWTLEVNGNQFDAFHVGTSYGQITAFGNGESATFMNYRRTNIGSISSYHRVYLGSCTNRTFTTNPSTTPNIELHGQVKVTSTANKSIKSTSVLTVSASNIATTNLTVTSNNSTFKLSLTSNGTYSASVNIPVVSNKVGVTPIYVEYTPTEITNGIEEATITVSDGDVTPTEVSTESGDVQGRHVPANFVIAAKWGNKWYALPANCTESTSSTTGVLIEVDNASDPTRATAAPSYTKWGLQTVRQSRKPDYGSRLVFTEQLTTATVDDQKTLYNGSTTSIQANAMYKNYMDVAADKYEWIPTTTDLKDYILTSATTLGGEASARTVSLSNKGVFGTLLMNKSNDGKVRILPADFYEPVEMQVIEWKANSLVVMYGGAGIKATTQVGNNDPSDLQTLASAKVDHGVYELSTSQALTGSTNMPLTIAVKNGSDVTTGTCALIVPAIVTGAQDAPLGLTADEATLTDVVVTDGATLSAAATKYTFKNITVYPGGKLVIGSGKQLGMASLTLRGGSAWGAATYEHKYPQFVVNNATSGAYSNTSGVINYDYVTTKDQYYSFVLPYASNTKNIKYPLDIYGSAVSASNTGSFEFQYYDGAARAAGGTGWKVLAEPATLVAGTGYTFLGMPKKVDAYDGTDDSHANTRQRYGIHRIPMSVAAATVQAGETNSDPGKATPIRVTLASKNNNSGWALVGNPYLSNVSGLDNTDIQVGKLVHTDTNPWDGKWQWDNPTTGVRYIVLTDDGQTFESQQAITATLKAFKNFFVQIQNGEATSLVIPANSRTDKNLAPARYMADVEQDIQLAVDLVSETRSDKVDLLINDVYTAEFDQDGDFTKMMNTTKFNLYGVYPGDNLSFIAVDKTTAAGSIAIGYQVPAAGEYTLQLSERPYVMSDYVETLLVTDHEVSPEVTTDLLENPYSFTVTKAETNDARFTVSIKLKENQDTPTDIDIINGGGDLDGEKPIKFIYHDKMYILRNGVLYDATGKKVREINK